MKKYKFILSLFFLCGLSGHTYSKGGEVLRLIQSQYQSISSFSGKFVQISFKRNTDIPPKKAKGRVSYKRPGKMRWLYSLPEEHLLVINGGTLWLFDPLLENVTVQKLEKIADGTALSFLLGIGDLNKDFRQREISRTFLQKQDDLTVELVPKKPNSNLAFIQLQVHPKKYDLKKILMMDKQENYSTIELNSLKYNIELEDKLFEFKITEDMEVIEAGY